MLAVGRLDVKLDRNPGEERAGVFRMGHNAADDQVNLSDTLLDQSV